MRSLLSMLLLLLSTNLFAQNSPAGDWSGKLEVGGMSLRVVLHIATDTAGGLTATMDSPDQGAKGIPIPQVVQMGTDSIAIAIPQAGIAYAGRWGKEKIEGVFGQGGLIFPLTLNRITETPEIKRPQEPKPPFPYRTEEVTFKNEAAGITLAGTLTMPQTGKDFPAVVLITGSGAQNRNEEVLGHKPFLVLADYLTRQGIAVLRYDDRGTAGSGGVFKGATSADFAQDAKAALDYLRSRKETDRKKVGLAGHSEGGIIAPMLAASNPKEVAFTVLLAPPAISGDSILLLQQGLIATASGMPAESVAELISANRGAFKIVRESEDTVALRTKMEAYLSGLIDAASLPAGTTKEAAIAAQINPLTDPWMHYFMRTDPASFLQKVKCPVLALWGANDLQVPPAQNEPALKAALAAGGNKKGTTAVLPGLNHLFQSSATGLPTEYGQIEETFSLPAMLQIAAWIKETTATKK